MAAVRRCNAAGKERTPRSFCLNWTPAKRLIIKLRLPTRCKVMFSAAAAVVHLDANPACHTQLQTFQFTFTPARLPLAAVTVSATPCGSRPPRPRWPLSRAALQLKCRCSLRCRSGALRLRAACDKDKHQDRMHARCAPATIAWRRMMCGQHEDLLNRGVCGLRLIKKLCVGAVQSAAVRPIAAFVQTHRRHQGRKVFLRCSWFHAAAGLTVVFLSIGMASEAPVESRAVRFRQPSSAAID